MPNENLLGIQNAPNQVPGRLLRNLNDFAEQAGRIPANAVDNLSWPPYAGFPLSAPTLVGPAWLRLLSQMVRGSARDAMGIAPDQNGPTEFTFRNKLAGE